VVAFLAISSYQVLQKTIWQDAQQHGYKREADTGDVYRMAYFEGNISYAYVFWKSSRNYLKDLLVDHPRLTSQPGNLDNLDKLMKDFPKREFPFLVRNRFLLGFRNGVLELRSNIFTDRDAFQGEYVVHVYLEHDYPAGAEPGELRSLLFFFYLIFVFQQLHGLIIF